MRSKDDMFFEFEFVKRAGFIGSQTPENFECNALFDYQEKMAQCLFPNQNLLCWNADYWLHK
jgi:hypothetical protein